MSEQNVMASILTDSSEPSEYWSDFPPKTLKSFVLQYSDRVIKNISLQKEMKNIIEEIAKRSISNLRCLWTSIALLKDEKWLFNLKDMIAQKNCKIEVTPFPPAMESLENDWCVIDLVPSSKLKQIECTFELEVISYWAL